MTTLHVAPHPAGGWVVEDERRLLAPERYADRQEAIAEASFWLDGHGLGRLVVHDERGPVAAAEYPLEHLSATGT